MKNTRLILLPFLLLMTACAGSKDHHDPSVRFALRPEQIDGWEERGEGIAVRLNAQGRRELYALTGRNVGKEMQIYAGRTLLTTTPIAAPLRGDNLYVAIDNDVAHDRALSMLPPSKKSG